MRAPLRAIRRLLARRRARKAAVPMLPDPLPVDLAHLAAAARGVC